MEEGALGLGIYVLQQHHVTYVSDDYNQLSFLHNHYYCNILIIHHRPTYSRLSGNMKGLWHGRLDPESAIRNTYRYVST